MNYWKLDHESAAGAGSASNVNSSTVRFDHLFNQAKTQAAPLYLRLSGSFSTKEGVEQVGKFSAWDSFALVVDGDLDDRARFGAGLPRLYSDDAFLAAILDLSLIHI